jgi:hypothetical protein
MLQMIVMYVLVGWGQLAANWNGTTYELKLKISPHLSETGRLLYVKSCISRGRISTNAICQTQVSYGWKYTQAHGFWRLTPSLRQSKNNMRTYYSECSLLNIERRQFVLYVQYIPVEIFWQHHKLKDKRPLKVKVCKYGGCLTFSSFC